MNTSYIKLDLVEYERLKDKITGLQREVTEHSVSISNNAKNLVTQMRYTAFGIDYEYHKKEDWIQMMQEKHDMIVQKLKSRTLWQRIINK